MMLRTDDDLYVVDQVWLGPPGKELPWHARYSAYGWGFAIYLTLMLLERSVLHVPFGFWTLVWTLIGTIALTGLVMRHVTPDRSFLAVLRGWRQELTAPRPLGTSRHRRARPGPQRVRMTLVRARSSPPGP